MSILVDNGDREFTRLNPRFSRVDVELTRANQICIDVPCDLPNSRVELSRLAGKLFARISS